MDGGLLGEFDVTSFRPLYLSKSRLVAEGTERFRPATGALIDGRCTQPITGGLGDFSGARGLITMHDVPTKNGVHTTYRGEVVLHAVRPATGTRTDATALPTPGRAARTLTC